MLRTSGLPDRFCCPLAFVVLLVVQSVVIPVFTQRLHFQKDRAPQYILALTAEERTRSRLQVKSDEGRMVNLRLPRGILLRDGDWLQSEQGEVAQVRAKPEPVLTVTTMFPLALLQTAYYLGHRHIPLEITAGCLRLSPDPVLHQLLRQRGLQVLEEVAPFQPEINFDDRP
jgi:urease accessory protein